MKFFLLIVCMITCCCKSEKNTQEMPTGVTIIVIPEPQSSINISKIQEFRKNCQEQPLATPYANALNLVIVDRVCASDTTFPEARDRALRVIPPNQRIQSLDLQLIDIVQNLKINNEALHGALVDVGWIYLENIEIYLGESGVWNIQLRGGSNQVSQLKPIAIFGAEKLKGKSLKVKKCYLSPANDFVSKFYGEVVKPYQQILFVLDAEELQP